MLKSIRYGLAVASLVLPLLAQAEQCSSRFLKTCDFSFTATPVFPNFCLGTPAAGTYTIRNNTPVSIKLNYIRLRDNDALPTPAATIIAAPTNNCSTSRPLAAGATCNIRVNLLPLVAGRFNRILEVGIDTRQIELDGPTIASLVSVCPIPPPVVPPVPAPGPFVPPVPPASLFSASILAYSTVTNTGPTVVNGDVDVSPGSAITGFGPAPTQGKVVNGALHRTDAVAVQARVDALAHYAALTALTCPAGHNLTGQNLGSLLVPLTPGVYCFDSSAFLTGALPLTGGPTSSYTFQIGSTLVTASNSSVVLAGGLSPGNVNWAVGSAATLGTGTLFQGTIAAQSSITLTTGVTLIGRAWALGGAVTMDTNLVNPN